MLQAINLWLDKVGIQNVFVQAFISCLAVICGTIGLIFYLADSRLFDVEGKRLPGPANNLIAPNFYTVARKARISKQVINSPINFCFNHIYIFVRHQKQSMTLC
jgi:hypothetical protein